MKDQEVPLLTVVTSSSLIEVVVPSLLVMKNFHSLVSAIFKMIYSNQVENMKLTIIRDTLLPKLMNGEVNINNSNI